MRLVRAAFAAILLSQVFLIGTASATEPPVVSQRWVIMDRSTATILAARDPFVEQPVASLTKVMTAVVALERSHLDLPVTITAGDVIGESSAGLIPGDVVTLRTLLHGLLLKSGNDAAMAIARAVGGSTLHESPNAREQFFGWMNEKAATLGMTNTHFTNPHGLDQAGHYSTAFDLAILTRYALDVSGFAPIFGARSYSGDGYSYVHGNRLPETMDGIIGGKTGWTDGCGLCLIEVAEQHGREIIVVLLQSDWTWYDDAKMLFDYAWTLPDPADNGPRAEAVFGRLWNRTDGPVEDGGTGRSWVWGRPVRPTLEIAAAHGASTRGYERLYEKGLMEILQPYSRMDTGWYVTAGRLAAELIEGRANVKVAGDLGFGGVTYRMLADHYWDMSQVEGAVINMRLSLGGNLSDDAELAAYGQVAGPLARETGFHTALVFASFLNQSGPVYNAGLMTEELLFDPPLHAIGYPITPPFWVSTLEQGRFVDVMVQCFERRCLTYTPSHAAEWQVEMSNIGLHYGIWKRWITLEPQFAGRRSGGFNY